MSVVGSLGGAPGQDQGESWRLASYVEHCCPIFLSFAVSVAVLRRFGSSGAFKRSRAASTAVCGETQSTIRCNRNYGVYRVPFLGWNHFEAHRERDPLVRYRAYVQTGTNLSTKRSPTPTRNLDDHFLERLLLAEDYFFEKTTSQARLLLREDHFLRKTTSLRRPLLTEDYSLRKTTF